MSHQGLSELAGDQRGRLCHAACPGLTWRQLRRAAILALLVLICWTLSGPRAWLLGQGRPASVAEAAASAAGGPAAQWPMSGGGPTHDGRIAARGPDQGTLAWSASLGRPARGGPVIDDAGRVYTADRSRVRCWAEDGTEVWSASPGDPGPGGLALGRGPDGVPQVYCGTRDPTRFWCLDARSGNVRWHVSLGADPDGAPCVGPDGTVHFGGEDGRLRSVSAAGKLLRSVALGSPIRSAPAVGEDGEVYALTSDGTLYAYSPDGRRLWHEHLGAASDSAPALGPEGRIYLGDNNGRAWCFDSDGEVVYRVQVCQSALTWPAVAADGSCYYGCQQKRLYSLDPAGQVAWSQGFGGSLRASMAPLIDALGHVYTGCADGSLRALDPEGGILWQLDLGGEPSPLAANAEGAIALATTSGRVVLTVDGPAGGPAPPEPPPEPPSGPWEPGVVVPPAGGQDGWHVSYPVVAIVPFPASSWPDGVALRWQAPGADPGAGAVAAGPVAVEVRGQGELTLRLWLDGPGAPQGEVTVPLRIDTEPPVLDVAWPRHGEVLADGAGFEPRIEAGDGASGLERLTISLDGRALEAPAALGSGEHVLLVEARDRAGLSRSLERHFSVGQACQTCQNCQASSLHPVLSGLSNDRCPPWSRFITVLLHVPVDVARGGAPAEISLEGVPGKLAARLPVPSASQKRLYLVRFGREEVLRAAQALLGTGTAPGRWQRLEFKLTWTCGQTACAADVQLLYRP